MYNSHTKESFIEKAVSVHGDKYDYSLVEYRNNRTKVKIICPHHGVFGQTPDAHMVGKGCRNCALLKMGRKKADRIRSRYKGVGYDNTAKKWIASMYYDGQDHVLGRFDNEADAGKAYQEATLRIRNPQPIINQRDEAWVNFIEKGCDYAISNIGRIKSFNYNNMGFESLITQRINLDGYLTVSFQGGMVRVHVLVAKYFIGERREGYVINHIDGNKRNNAVSNLEYITVRSNLYHSIYQKTGSLGIKTGGDGRYVSIISVNGRSKILGRFFNREDAFDAFLNGLLKYELYEDHDYVLRLINK